MKKLLMIATIAGLMSTNAMAGTSTIDQIWVKDTATVLYFANGKTCTLSTDLGHSADYIQRMMATALTAQTSGATVTFNIDGAACKNMFLQQSL